MRRQCGVYSEVGRGTSFTVYFPASTVTTEEIGAPTPVHGPSRVGGETVLVVEDSEGLRVLTMRLLFLHKPFTAGTLERKIREVLDQ